MASLRSILLSLLVVYCAAASDVFDRVLDDVDSCEDSCDKTFASHTYENGEHNSACKRGCRFYSIMSFIHNHEEPNATKGDCMNSCDEAYYSDNRTSSACKVGCQSQIRVPETHTHQNPEEEEPVVHMLYPLLYMHSMYSNMIDKVYRHMEVTWSVFMQADDGKLVVIRSEPRIINIVAVDGDGEGVSEKLPWLDDKTSMSLETNIAGQDNSATPLLNYRASQMKAAHADDGLEMDVTDEWQTDAGRTDWLSCVARKTGIARIILCFIILATAIVMIWFCLTAAATAPEQQLSINGDLEYLRSLSEKEGFRLLHPQARVEARPLPVKIRVEQI